MIVAAGSAAPVGSIDREAPFYENSNAPQFAAILQEYKIAEDSGYAADTVWNLPNVNKELASSSYKKNLYYMVEDISGDATQIRISMYDPRYQSIVHPNGFQIYDMYRLNNGIPERIFDIRTMGYRAIYTICVNIIRCYGSGGVNSHNEKFYLLNGSNASIIQTITFDKPYYTLNDAKNLNRMITKDEADKIINSYK